MNPQTFGPDPAPDTKRLLLTVVVMTAFIVVWQLLNPPTPPPAQAPADAVATATPDETAESKDAPEAEAEETDFGATPKTLPVETHVVEADVAGAGRKLEGVKGGYRATLTNQGAQLMGFELTGYVDPNVKPSEGDDDAKGTANIELAKGEHDGARLLALRSRGGDVKLDDDAAYEVVETSASGAVYRRVLPSGVTVTRKLSFEPDRFAFRHEVTLENKSASAKTAELDLVLVGAEREGERESGGLFAPQTDQLAAVCKAGGEYERFLSRELEKPEVMKGPVSQVGLDRHFFLAAVVPDAGTKTSGCTLTPWKVGTEKNAPVGLEIAIEHEALTLAPGGSATLSHVAYFGPKQLDLLQDFGHGLDENVDFGWFGFLSRPMLWILVKAYELVGNFGIAIILLTLLMKLLTFPLTQKSYVSMQQMKTLAPELKKLQEKYAHDRAMLGQKQMEMYKEKGINPLAGCFPVLVQMPIWFALYRTLWNSVELYQQPFFAWITDLSQPDASPLFGWPLLPLLVGGLMLGQTLMQPPPEDQPQMKYVMWGMPIMFTFFMLQMPSGLSLYMITNSVLTIAQQAYIKRRYK